ncbi:MAG: hypothetical protein ACRDTX_21585 [Pseudonocardiaceae bacterium]
MPVAGAGGTVGQTSHRLVSEALGEELRQAVHTGPSALDRADSIRYRVSAVLYLLLRDHSIDRRGRCRSCRRPRAMITIRRQPCRILIKARYWLLGQPDEAQLLCLLAAELPAISPSPPSARGAHQPIHPGPNEQGRDSRLGDTAVRPVLAASPSTESPQTPALPSPLLPTASRGRESRTTLYRTEPEHTKTAPRLRRPALLRPGMGAAVAMLGA